MTNQSFVTNPSPMIPILLTAWETHPRFKYHVLFSSRDVEEEADFTMWGSGFRFRCCKASPIFWDQKSNFMYITNCASKTTYVSIVVSTVQENSSQSRSFKISSYLSLDFVGKPALRYIYLHQISLTPQHRCISLVSLPILLPRCARYYY